MKEKLVQHSWSILMYFFVIKNSNYVSKTLISLCSSICEILTVICTLHTHQKSHQVALSNFYDHRVRAACPSLSLLAHLYSFSYFCSKEDHHNPHNCPSQKFQISLYTFFNPKLKQSLPCNYFADPSTSYQHRTGLDHLPLGFF